MSKHAALLEAAPCHLLDGRSVADEILDQVARDVAELTAGGRQPRLVSVIFGDPGAAEVYVRNQRRVAARVGIEFVEAAFDAGVDEAEALAALEQLNADPAVTGIIIQRPVPPQLSVKRLQGAVQPAKDVEGMHPDSIGQIVYGLSEIGPCTAIAAVELLKRTGLTIQGLEVVVIGHSEIVGKPIAFLLMAEGATVTVCHHMTRSVAMHARRADAVFVAVGKPKLVGASMIKPGAAVIDIGINPVKDDAGKSRVVGDVDFDEVRHVAGWLTPVPGGVGPVTLSVLVRNTVYAARLQRRLARARHAPAEPAGGEFDRLVVRDLVVEAGLPHHGMRIGVELETRRGTVGEAGLDGESVVGLVNRVLATDGPPQGAGERIAAACLEDSRVRGVRVRIEDANAAGGAAIELQRRGSAGA
jgi:methylenetetrahydrofolate dehydrogenase (NADP+) / methenyltetrahydrofolate cyclohydrolase